MIIFHHAASQHPTGLYPTNKLPSQLRKSCGKTTRNFRIIFLTLAFRIVKPVKEGEYQNQNHITWFYSQSVMSVVYMSAIKLQHYSMEWSQNLPCIPVRSMKVTVKNWIWTPIEVSWASYHLLWTIRKTDSWLLNVKWNLVYKSVGLWWYNTKFYFSCSPPSQCPSPLRSYLWLLHDSYTTEWVATKLGIYV